MATTKMMMILGVVIVTLIFGMVVIGFAGKIFPQIPQFICNFIEPLENIKIFEFKPIDFPGCG